MKTIQKILSICLFTTYCYTESYAAINDSVCSNAQSVNRFAVDLYQQLYQKSNMQNFCFSPFSISTSMAMTYAGAEQNTAIQIAKTFYWPTHRDTFLKNNKSLTDSILNTKGVFIANSLWTPMGFFLNDSYIADIKYFANAELETIQTENAINCEKSRLYINKWVESRTNNKIINMIPSGIIDTDTRLLLINALYLKRTWKSTFDIRQTFPATFYTTTSDSVQTNFMSQQLFCKYKQTAGYQCIELPYKNTSLSMVFVVPTNGFENIIHIDTIQTIMQNTDNEYVAIHIPIFKVATTLELNKILQNMGVTDAFSAKANFSGINGNTDLYLSNALHKTVIEVNEQGTEAAAASATVLKLKSAFGGTPKTFYANKPFLFILKDSKTNTVLFIGKLGNPTKQ